MSVAPPRDPVLPPPRRPWGILVLVAVVVVAVGWLAFSSVGNALVYYRTPSEVAELAEPPEEVLRLGGMVKEGTIEREEPGSAYELRFVLTDGTAEVPVVTTNAPTASFREGSGAVVEGRFSGDGTFEATQVIVKHDENYEVPASGAQPSDNSFVPGE